MRITKVETVKTGIFFKVLYNLYKPLSSGCVIGVADLGKSPDTDQVVPEGLSQAAVGM